MGGMIVQAMAINADAARLMGIRNGSMLLLAFCLSAFIGAVILLAIVNLFTRGRVR